MLDSLAAATGGDAGAEAATKVFRAIRSLHIGALIIAHIPKSPGEGQEPSIYGSVFHKNFARATWELRKEQEVDSDTSILGLFQSEVESQPDPRPHRAQGDAEQREHADAV